MQLAFKNSVEAAIGDYVVIDLQDLEGNSSVYYSAFYNQPDGVSNSIDLVFGAGWGPDYGDPLTYIHCFDTYDGDMLPYSGLNQENRGGQAVTDLQLLEDDRRVEALAGMLGGDHITDTARATARELLHIE